MGIGKQSILVVLLTASAACKPDLELLTEYLPAGVQPVEVVSTKMRLLNCQQATFIVESNAKKVTQDWALLDGTYSSSFVRCLTDDEVTMWDAAAIQGNVRWYVFNDGREIHYWHDIATHRFLVMQLST